MKYFEDDGSKTKVMRRWISRLSRRPFSFKPQTCNVTSWWTQYFLQNENLLIISWVTYRQSYKKPKIFRWERRVYLGSMSHHFRFWAIKTTACRRPPLRGSPEDRLRRGGRLSARGVRARSARGGGIETMHPGWWPKNESDETLNFSLLLSFLNVSRCRWR